MVIKSGSKFQVLSVKNYTHDNPMKYIIPRRDEILEKSSALIDLQINICQRSIRINFSFGLLHLNSLNYKYIHILWPWWRKTIITDNK